MLLADSACRACPSVGDVFESCSGSYASLRISFCRIVYVSADNANILIHNLMSFGCVVQFSDHTKYNQQHVLLRL